MKKFIKCFAMTLILPCAFLFTGCGGNIQKCELDTTGNYKSISKNELVSFISNKDVIFGLPDGFRATSIEKVSEFGYDSTRNVSYLAKKIDDGFNAFVINQYESDIPSDVNDGNASYLKKYYINDNFVTYEGVNGYGLNKETVKEKYDIKTSTYSNINMEVNSISNMEFIDFDSITNSDDIYMAIKDDFAKFYVTYENNEILYQINIVFNKNVLFGIKKTTTLNQMFEDNYNTYKTEFTVLPSNVEVSFPNLNEYIDCSNSTIALDLETNVSVNVPTTGWTIISGNELNEMFDSITENYSSVYDFMNKNFNNGYKATIVEKTDYDAVGETIGYSISESKNILYSNTNNNPRLAVKSVGTTDSNELSNGTDKHEYVYTKYEYYENGNTYTNGPDSRVDYENTKTIKTGSSKSQIEMLEMIKEVQLFLSGLDWSDLADMYNTSVVFNVIENGFNKHIKISLDGNSALGTSDYYLLFVGNRIAKYHSESTINDKTCDISKCIDIELLTQKVDFPDYAEYENPLVNNPDLANNVDVNAVGIYDQTVDKIDNEEFISYFSDEIDSWGNIIHTTLQTKDTQNNVNELTNALISYNSTTDMLDFVLQKGINSDMYYYFDSANNDDFYYSEIDGDKTKTKIESHMSDFLNYYSNGGVCMVDIVSETLSNLLERQTEEFTPITIEKTNYDNDGSYKVKISLIDFSNTGYDYCESEDVQDMVIYALFDNEGLVKFQISFNGGDFEFIQNFEKTSNKIGFPDFNLFK